MLDVLDGASYAPHPADRTVETKVSMSNESRSRGIRIVRDGDSTHVLDVHCGHCAACQVALDYWCLDARHDGELLFSLDTPASPEELRRWLGGLAALSTARSAPDAVLMVLEDVDQRVAADLVRPWHAGPVLSSVDGRDDEARARLAELSPTGRAQVVLTLQAARTAVRSVERGGQVCLPDVPVDGPSVAELVQRDVRLLAPRRIEDLVARTSWAELAGPLERVLDTNASPVGAGQ
jgi:hypothetical protein